MSYALLVGEGPSIFSLGLAFGVHGVGGGVGGPQGVPRAAVLLLVGGQRGGGDDRHLTEPIVAAGALLHGAAQVAKPTALVCPVLSINQRSKA